MTAPVEYLFFMLTALAVIVLRIKDRDLARPFAVPAYPWMPLFFCAWCAFMLYGSIVYAGIQAVFGLAPAAGWRAALLPFASVGPLPKP